MYLCQKILFMKKLLFLMGCLATLSAQAQTTCNYAIAVSPNGSTAITGYVYTLDSLPVATPTAWTLSNGTMHSDTTNYVHFTSLTPGWYQVCATPQGCPTLCDSVEVVEPVTPVFVQNIPIHTMMEDFFQGSCVTVSNVTYAGNSVATGYFQGASTPLGLNAGILLTSGEATNAALPNIGAGTGTNVGGVGDDPQMNTLAQAQTFDGAFIDFDFVSTEDTLKFKYIFASEEYPEFVCNGFNDVFAFFVSGGDFVAPVNIAAVPNTNNSIPVSINTINNLPNCANQTFPQYYTENSDNYMTYDGMTVPLWAMTQVTPGVTYHARIAIADAGDGIYDSGVFIGSESLCGSEMVAPVATFTANRTGNTVAFANGSRYGTRYLWDFGDGNTSTEMSPTHTYATDLTTTGYDVSLRVTNYCCETTYGMRVGFNSSTNTNNEQLSAILAVQPNPANDFLQLNLKNGQPTQINLFDITGKMLLTKTITTSERLDLTPFAKGIMLLQVVQNGTTYHSKVVHQ